MKRQMIPLSITALLLSVCAIGGNSSATATDTLTTVPITATTTATATATSATRQDDVKTWSNADANLMAQYLHGEVLPYIELIDTSVVYDDDYQEIVIMGNGLQEGGLGEFATFEEFASAVKP